MKMPNSFFNRSPFKGPMPFKYSMGLDNILFAGMMPDNFYKYIGNCGYIDLWDNVAEKMVGQNFTQESQSPGIT